MTRQQEYYRRNKEKVRASNKAWAEANPEKMAAYLRAHKSKPENRAKGAAASKKWKDENPERRREQCREWRAKNREKSRALWNNRRAKQLASGSYTEIDVSEIFKSQKGKCAYCRSQLVKYHVDHITPLSRGGSNLRSNLQVLCPTCNVKKSNTDPITFAQKNGLLL